MLSKMATSEAALGGSVCPCGRELSQNTQSTFRSHWLLALAGCQVCRGGAPTAHLGFFRIFVLDRKSVV